MKPKYSFEMLYVSPFTKKLGFDEKELKTIYVPLEQKRLRTGLEVVDLVVDKLVAGQDPSVLPWQLGMKPTVFSTTLKTLTGMTLVEMRTRWRMTVAYELLRYTELPLQEVMSRIGYTSAQSFSRMFRKAYGAAPLKYRIQCRAQGDIGKYAL
ncbi:MAG: helix-turn-helix transcriptional regulator [Bacteroidaceae bacterium]|nr:helix-turn-helix transcriptional regulator [Bacteroidaceae bacterium]